MNHEGFDPEIAGQVIEVCLRDETFARYQRERLELIYEHLDITEHSPRLEARFDPLRKKGRLRVLSAEGSEIFRTEVRKWG